MDKLKDTLRVFVVPTEILDEELDIYEKMAYMVLRSYANGQDDTAFPSYATIAKKGSMSRPKAINCVKKLIELGLVVKEERKKVSKDGKISDTSNLYTIYRPAEVKNKSGVNGIYHPSKQDLPPLVNGIYHPSKHGLPENNYLKELDLKRIEEEEKQSELISFLLSKDIKLENAQRFENALLKENITGYTYEQILQAIELSLIDFVNGDCNEPYVWAVGKLKRLLDGKVKAVEGKKKKRKGKTVVRKELLPDWFDEKQSKAQQPDDEMKKRVQEKMKRLKEE